MKSENCVARSLTLHSSLFILHLHWYYFHVSGLFFAEGQMVAAQAEFDWIAQRSAADDFDLRAVAEAHLQKPPAVCGRGVSA